MVNLSKTTHIESCCLWVWSKPTKKSIFMSSHFQVGTWISCSKPPDFWCCGFHLLEIWTLSNKLCYALVQTFLPKYFTKVMVHFYRTRMNGITGPMGFLKIPIPQLSTLGTHNHQGRLRVMMDHKIIFGRIFQTHTQSRQPMNIINEVFVGFI